jgi:type I restriction enzyme M protein
VEEETEELDKDGNPKVRRRKADDEHLIRRNLLQGGVIDAVISLPLNIFYGAGVPACLLILRRQRPPERQNKVLLVYAARHYRELSAQNQLRPQDVMRILVHVQAFGDADKGPALVDRHAGRIRAQITQAETEEVDRITAEFAEHAERLATLDADLAAARAEVLASKPKATTLPFDTAAPITAVPESKGARPLEARIARLEKTRATVARKVAERDERIAETRRRAEEDRRDVDATGDELVALYADPGELLKHTRLVSLDEIEENEFNLNIPRYVDTFEPEPRVEVEDALRELRSAELAARQAECELQTLLEPLGYAL